MWRVCLEKYQQMNIAEERESDERLPREFFTRDGLTVARELLGKILVHETSLGTIRGVITEVESYMGIHDKGSHTYGGRRTERTEPMFHQGGYSYVYFTYGMYHCMNITSGPEGDPQAVLIRSVVPADEDSKQRMLTLRMENAKKQARKKFTALVTAEENDKVRESLQEENAELRTADKQEWQQAMAAFLKKREKAVLKNLADGPGKMCIAMEISKADNDVDMLESQTFYVTEGIEILPEEIREGRRIGIDYAEEAADYLWRFYVE